MPDENHRQFVAALNRVGRLSSLLSELNNLMPEFADLVRSDEAWQAFSSAHKATRLEYEGAHKAARLEYERASTEIRQAREALEKLPPE